MNKLRLLSYNIRKSIIFVLITTVTMAVCMLLINQSLSSIRGIKFIVDYYSAELHDKVFFEDLPQVDELSEKINTDDLASIFTRGQLSVNNFDENFFNMLVVTPAFYDNMPKIDIRGDLKNSAQQDYYNACVSKDTGLDLNKIFALKHRVHLGYAEDNQPIYEYSTVRVKPVAYFAGDCHYDLANMRVDGGATENAVMILDDIASYQYVSGYNAILMSDMTIDDFADTWYDMRTIGEIYEEQLEIIDINVKGQEHTAVIAVIFSTVLIFVLYYIYVVNSSRKRAICYVCGTTLRAQIVTEIIKMIIVFILPICINGIAVAIATKNMQGMAGDSAPMYSTYGLWVSTLLMLGVYIIAIAVGLVKYISSNTVQIVNSEH